MGDQEIAESGDIVRVVGSRADPAGEEFVPIYDVMSMEATGLDMRTAMAFMFRDPDSPFLRVRDRDALPSCGLMVFNTFTGPDEPAARDHYADNRRCLLDAYRRQVGAEVVVLRDSVDAGYTTSLFRVLPDGGGIQIWSLQRYINNATERWTYSRCDQLTEELSDTGEPRFVPSGCVAEDP